MSIYTRNYMKKTTSIRLNFFSNVFERGKNEDIHTLEKTETQDLLKFSNK